MGKLRDIDAGYLWPSYWKKPGDSIYPSWWKEDSFYYDKMKANPPEEVLDIKPGNYTMMITYPLSNPYSTFVEVKKDGITRQELMDIAAASYHEIYTDMDKYGIWGHDMCDLTIHTFHISDTKRVITLGVDS